MNETDAKIYRLRAELIAAEAELTEANTAAARRQCLERYEQALDRYSDLALRPKADVAASCEVAIKRPCWVSGDMCD